MNTAVQLYRQNYPDDQRSDDEITLDLGQKYPDLIQSIPNASSDFARIQQQITDANKPGPVDYAKQAAGSVIRGAVDSVAGVAKAIGTGGQALDRAFGLPELQIGGGDGVKVVKSEDIQPGDNSALSSKLGNTLTSFGEKASPAPVDSLKDSFWATKIPNTIGSIGAFVATGGLGKALVSGTVKAVTKAVAEDAAKELVEGGMAKAAAKELAEQYAQSAVQKSVATHIAEATPAAIMGASDQAVGAYQDAMAKTNDPDKAFKAYLANLPVGAAMALPAGRLVPGGETGSTVARIIKDTLLGTGVMAGQQVAGNVIAQNTYDPERSTTEGLEESAGAGGIVTAALSALSHGLLGSKSGESSKTPATPPIKATPEPEINPLINYPSIAPDLKVKVDDVLKRQAGGETGPAIESALNSIYAEPQAHRYYAEERSRMAEAKAPTEEPTQVEAPPTSATPPAVVGNPDSGVTAAQPAPDVATGRLDDARRAAATYLTGQKETDLPDMSAKKLEAMSTKQPYELTQDEFVALRTKQLADRGRALPAEQLAALHEKVVTDAVKNGQDVPDRVLKKYPSISAEASGTTPKTANVPSTVPAITGQPAESTAAKQPVTASADQSATDMAPSKTPPVPTINPTEIDSKLVVQPWTRAEKTNSDDLVKRAAFSESKVTSGEGGKGKKGAAAYTETADPEELYKDASSNKDDRNSSRKLGVFQSPDGSHVAVGTAYENGRGDAARKVTFFNDDGHPQSIQFKKLIAAGYKLIASVKTSEPTKAYSVTYSAHEWAKAQTELRARSAEVKQGGVEPVSESVAKEMIGGGEQQQGASVVSSPNAPVEEWGKGGGKIEPALVDKLMTAVGEPKWSNGEEAHLQITDALNEMDVKEATAILERISPRDARSGQQDFRTGFDLLVKKLYEAYEKTDDPQKVARQLTGISEGSGQSKSAGGKASSAEQTSTGASATRPERGVSGADANRVSASEGAGSGEQSGTADPANGQVIVASRSERGVAKADEVKVKGLSVVAPERANPESNIKSLLNPIQPSKSATPAERLVASISNAVRRELANKYGGQLEAHPNRGAFTPEDARHLQEESHAVGKELSAEPTARFAEVANGLLDKYQSGLKEKAGATDEDMAGFRKRIEDAASIVNSTLRASVVRLGVNDASSIRVAVEFATRGMAELAVALKALEPSMSVEAAKEHLRYIFGASENAISTTAPKMIRFSERPNAPGATSTTHLKSQWDSVLETAAENGIRLTALQGLHEGGEWQRRAVTLTVADAAKPTSDNVTLAIHELAGHPVFDSLTDAQKQMMYRAFEKVGMPDGSTPKIADGANVREVTAEETLVERASRNLQAEGFDPKQAGTIAQRVVRLLRGIYLRAALAIQSGLLGDDHVSPDLAQKYFENRMRQYLAGDLSPMSFISFIGGAKPSVEQRGDYFSKVGGEGSTSSFDMSTGRMGYREVLPETMAALTQNHNVALADIRYSDRPNLATVKTFDPHIISRDLNSTAKVEEDIAAYNALDDMHRAAFKVFDKANPGKQSYEDFISNFTNSDGPAMEKVTLRNADLTANQLPQADPTLRPHDLVSEASQMQAADKAYRYAVSLRADWTARRVEAERFLKTADERLARKNTQLADLTKDYTNADLIFNQAKQRSGELIKTLGESAKQLGNNGYKLGTLEQVIKNLEGTISRPLLSQYEKVLNRLYAKLSTGDGAMKFTDMLERVARLGVDWEGDSATDIRDAIKMVSAGDPLLEPFTQNTTESKALLAMAVAFGKSDSHVMDFLQMRRSSAIEERQVVNKALDIAMGNNANAITEARQLVRKLPKLGKVADHLLQKLQQLKTENHALLDENKRNRTFIDFHEQALPALQAQMTQLERMIGAKSPSWEANDKAEYHVAPKPDATDDQVALNKATFRLTDVENNFAVKQHIEQNNAWLDKQTPDKRGALWNTVKEQTTKLENAVGVATHELAIKNSFVNNYLGSIIDKLESTGLPSLRASAQRFRRYRAEQYSSNAEADVKGTAWAGAESRAMKTLGFETAGMGTFERLFYQAAHSFAEKNADHWATFKDPKAAFDAFMPKLREYFQRSADPDTRERMQRPGAWTALEALYRADYDSNESVDNFRRKLGVKIQEQMPDGSTIEREPIGSTWLTAMRRAPGKTVRMYQNMRDAGWLGTKDKNSFDPAAVADAYNQDPAALDDHLKQYLTPDIARDFIKPLVTGMEGRSAFYAPTGEDGVTNVALTENVKKAYEQSQGSMVQFAKNLFDLESANHGTTESEAEFVGKTVAQFKDFFDGLHSQFKDMDDNSRQGNATPPRVLQDARVSESWPGEWLEYHTFGRFQTHELYNHLSGQAAFGRNLDGMRRDMQTGVNELSGKAGQLADITARVQDENRSATGKKLQKLIQAEVERRGFNYTDLSQSTRNLAMVRQEQRNFEAIMNMHGGLALELRPFMELVSAAAGATVQGPVTALLHIPNLYAQFSKLGLGPASLSVMKRGMSSTASEMAGTLMQMFHTQIGWNADRNARRVRNGIVDPDAMNTFSDRRAALLNDPTIASNPATRALFTLARSVRLATSTGIGRAAEGAENVYATAKPHALFSQTANHIDAGLIDGWTHGFEDHIERAIEYFKDPAHAGDLTDPTFKFTNLDQLGYSKGFLGIGSDERAFKYLTNALARYGIDFEGHAKDVLRQRATDSTVPALNDEQFRRMASLVQNEVTLESSVATRPSAFFTNPLLRMAAPLVGWSVAKSHDAWESWRNPDLTQTANNPMRRLAIGALPYLALVPAGVAMGAIRNLLQTNLTGKRANREDPTSAAGALDSLAWVGTFGLGGDVLNSMVNRDTQRPFDVDHRVFFISSMHSAISAMQNWYEQGSADYSTVYRPLMQALGGNGAIQYLDIANHALSLDNAEARVTARINVGNYLRVAGRELKLDVRVNDGGEVISNPLRPLIGQMVMSAFANNAQDFQTAYHQALAIATEEKGNRAEALDTVQRAFDARNPLKSVFRTPPTTQDVQRILASLPGDGKAAVSSAMQLFNNYGVQVINSKGTGLKPENGRDPKVTSSLLPTMTLDDVRRKAMAF